MTDIPALIERLNCYSCQEHTALGDDDGCVACEVWQDTRDAATALAEQAAEIKRLRAGHDEVLESLREIMGAVSWFVSQPERWEAAKARARQWLASTEGTTRDSTTDTPEPDNA